MIMDHNYILYESVYICVACFRWRQDYTLYARILDFISVAVCVQHGELCCLNWSHPPPQGTLFIYYLLIAGEVDQEVGDQLVDVTVDPDLDHKSTLQSLCSGKPYISDGVKITKSPTG